MEKNTKKGFSLIGFLSNMNLKVFTIILLLAMFLPMFRPILLPMYISPTTKTFNDFIISNKGGVAMWHAEAYAFGATAGLHAEIVAVMETLFLNQIKVIIEPVGAGSNAITPQFYLYVVQHYGLDKKYGYIYGTDYVVMPWLGQSEGAIASGTQFSNYPTDYLGTPINDIPLLQGKKTLADVDFVVVEYGICGTADQAIRQYYTQYGTPMLACQINCFSPTLAYVGKGYVSVIEGTQGAAEIETLNGIPGLGISYMAPASVLMVVFFLLLLISNIAFWGNRALGKKEEMKK